MISILFNCLKKPINSRGRISLKYYPLGKVLKGPFIIKRGPKNPAGSSFSSLPKFVHPPVQPVLPTATVLPTVSTSNVPSSSLPSPSSQSTFSWFVAPVVAPINNVLKNMTQQAYQAKSQGFPTPSTSLLARSLSSNTNPIPPKIAVSNKIKNVFNSPSTSNHHPNPYGFYVQENNMKIYEIIPHNGAPGHIDNKLFASLDILDSSNNCSLCFGRLLSTKPTFRNWQGDLEFNELISKGVNIKGFDNTSQYAGPIQILPKRLLRVFNQNLTCLNQTILNTLKKDLVHYGYGLNKFLNSDLNGSYYLNQGILHSSFEKSMDPNQN